MNQINKIHQKLATIQGKVKELVKTEENKFGKYKYFSEKEAIKLVKPLLEAEKLSLLFSDSPHNYHLSYEKQEKNHVIRYLKIANLGDGENEPLTFYFWAMGEDSDISKAKGKAETYAIKYFYSKFFNIPTTGEADADNDANKQ